MPTNLVEGPWKTRNAPDSSPTRRAHPLVIAALVATVALALGYLAYQGLTADVKPTEAISVAAGPDHPDGVKDGRYYPDDSIRTGVWQAYVPTGKTCAFEANSRASGVTDGVRSTPGTLTVSLTSSYVYVEFSGGCTWFRVRS